VIPAGMVNNGRCPRVPKSRRSDDSVWKMGGRVDWLAKLLTCLVALVIFTDSSTWAQDAVPTEIMARTQFIRWGAEAEDRLHVRISGQTIYNNSEARSCGRSRYKRCDTSTGR
jgi:hypothetical protein